MSATLRGAGTRRMTLAEGVMAGVLFFHACSKKMSIFMGRSKNHYLRPR
ncbi:hypothetical protein [Verminephrobacter eiseniae]|nr:hypothetical protein [Verminephrobacter eiseniae]